MFRKRIWLLIAGAGSLLLLWLAVGSMTVGATPPSQDGEPPNLDADYVGSGFCAMCHTQDDAWHASGHAQMVRVPSEDTILGDLSDTAAVTITWPDGSERPITAEDITYVLGGRYMQRYVSFIEREDGTPGYFVLPVQWNVPQTDDQTGVWTPFHADDWQEPSRDWRTACAGCHTTGLDGAAAAEQTAFAFTEDWQKDQIELNIGCEACHGPGGLHKGDAGTLVKTPDAQTCGQCHVQGADPGGEHGYPVGYQPGLALDESVFVLAAPDDESVWWPDGHARTYNQYGEWLPSAHGQTIAMGGVCARCHGTAPNIADVTLNDVVDGVTCMACHDPHASGLRLPIVAQEAPPVTPTPEATPEPTAAPDDEGSGGVDYAGDEDSGGVEYADDSSSGGDEYADEMRITIDTAANPRQPALQREMPIDYTLCVACHNSRTLEGDALLMSGKLHHPNQEMFEGWDMIETVTGVASAHYSAEGGPLCITCHMPKTVQIGEFGRVGSHTMLPVLPASEIEPDSCSGCHGDLVSRPALQQFIDDTQSATETRIFAIQQAAGNETADWVETVITFIEGDGSSGIHNPAYTDALLDAAEIELGIQLAVGEPSQEDLGIQPPPAETAEPEETNVAEGGLTVPSILLLAVVGVIIAAAAYAFFVREAGHG